MLYSLQIESAACCLTASPFNPQLPLNPSPSGTVQKCGLRNLEAYYIFFAILQERHTPVIYIITNIPSLLLPNYRTCPAEVGGQGQLRYRFADIPSFFSTRNVTTTVHDRNAAELTCMVSF